MDEKPKDGSLPLKGKKDSTKSKVKVITCLIIGCGFLVLLGSLIFIAVVLTRIKGHDRERTFQLHVKDYFNGKLDIKYNIVIEDDDAVLYDVLDKYQNSTENFSFEARVHEDLGLIIYSVNGLQQNESTAAHWMTAKMKNETCTTQMSSDLKTFIPQRSDEIIFAYTTNEEQDDVLYCSDQNPPFFQLEVRNFISEVEFSNSKHIIEMRSNTTLIKSLKKLQNTNENFRFTTAEYEGLGESITSVNGLKENSTLNYYWAIGKMVEDEMCLLPVGASFHYPQPDEYIVLAYFNLAMFSEYPTCGGGDHDDMTIQISVRNMVENVEFEDRSFTHETKLNTSLINMMGELRDTNSNFRYTAVNDGSHGAYITSINGLEQNLTAHYYWAILKMVDDKMCLTPVGAGSYYPLADEHVVFAYFILAMFSEYPTCGGGDHDDMTIKISVRNMVENVQFEEQSFTHETKFSTSLIIMMGELRDTNSNFRYTAVNEGSLGAYITSINGLEQNLTKHYYWAILKMVDDKMCLIPGGADAYYPLQDEHIVFAYFTLVMFSEYPTCGGGDHDDMTIQISVRNMVQNVEFEERSFTHETKFNTSLIDMMGELRDTNSNFRYTTVTYAGLGASIISINGLEQNSTLNYYWAIGMRVDDQMCLIPVGASSYYPLSDEHIVFAYFALAMFSEYPTCGGGDHNDISVQISVRNMVQNVQFEERLFSLETKFNTTLIDMMGQLRDTNSSFRFTTVMYEGLGASIESINGLKKNPTSKYYWSIGKIINDQMCLLPVGASSYHPQQDEHIVFAYFTLAMFSEYETCGGGYHDDITVQISVRNMVGNVQFEESSFSLETKFNTSLIDMIGELMDINSDMRFTTVTYAGLGASIQSINGLEQNSTLNYYWAIGQMVDGVMCLLPVGASSYHPQPNEHIVFAYFTLAMFSEYETCGGGYHDDITVQFSVRNMVEKVQFEDSSFSLRTEFNTSLIDMMGKLRDAFSSFRFTTVMYEGLGASIESINGLEQNSTSNHYWAIGKMVDGQMCLLSVDASSYYPESDEHIVFAYFTLAMFDTYQSCDGGSHE